jgi:hypothetical protein
MSDDLLTQFDIDQFETTKPTTGRKARAVDPNKSYEIIIDEVEGLPGYEFVGVNGTGYQIKRGEPVPVPGAVVIALQNAVTTAYKKQPHPTDPGKQMMVPYLRATIPWRFA